MTKYIINRFLVSIPVLLGITLVTFALIHLAPGDPVTGMIDPTLGDFSPELIARERAKLGLDQPLPVQYVLWLGRIVRGDLGYSLINRQPVSELIGQRIWSTLQLTISALIVGVIIAGPFIAVGGASLARPLVNHAGLEARLAVDNSARNPKRTATTANALLIGGATIDGGFALAARNIANIDVLPIQGINVYDILRRGTLVLSKAAVEALEERFK